MRNPTFAHALSRPGLSEERGFTLLELMISVLITLGTTAAIFTLVDPARGRYRTQPEVSDMQQRFRVGTSLITNDLLVAGAGSKVGGGTNGKLLNYFAPVQPVRLGDINPDPPNGVFYRDNAITIFYIPPDAAETEVAFSMPEPSAELQVAAEPSCDEYHSLSCKFETGMRLLIFGDDTGAFDEMTLTQVQDLGPDDKLQGPRHVTWKGNLQHNLAKLSARYAAGSRIAQVAQRTYYLDAVNHQLRFYDGSQRDEALVENVVSLQFEYYGESRGPVLVWSAEENKWVGSYGPAPPKLGDTTSTTWPAGENCTFRVDPVTGFQSSRLPDLVLGSQALVRLTEGMLTDGPWCPDETNPNRYDADLLRLRKVRVSMRLQVESADLRGAGALFSRPGTGQNARTLVADQESHFDVSPRNLNIGR